MLINDLDEEVASETATAIDGETTIFLGDLTKDGVCEELVQHAVDAFGALDIVVNNAGYTWDGMAHKMSDEQFRAMLEIHTVVPFRVLRAAAPCTSASQRSASRRRGARSSARSSTSRRSRERRATSDR